MGRDAVQAWASVGQLYGKRTRIDVDYGKQASPVFGHFGNREKYDKKHVRYFGGSYREDISIPNFAA
jgi:hypothetical protein